MDPVRPCAGRVAPVRIDSPVLSPCWVALCKYTRRKLNEQRRRCSSNMKFKTLKGISITSQSGRSSRSRSSYRSVSRRTKKDMRCEGWANMSAFCAMIDDDRRLRAVECRNGERQWFQLRLSKDVTVCMGMGVVRVWVCHPQTHMHTSSSAPLPLTTWAAQSRRLYSWCCKLKIFDFYATIRQRNDAGSRRMESGWQDM